VPERGLPALDAEPASLKRHLPKRRSLMTVIERVWRPPLKWGVVTVNSSPNPVREAVKAIKASPSLVGMKAPMPSWRKMGRPPHLYYDPSLLGGAFNAETAVRAYLEIVETQYGPERDGRLHRPHFNPIVPPSMSTPF
jgi:hypothetical protein